MEAVLQELIALTDSRFGFVGQVQRKPEGTPFLRIHAITDMRWDAASQERYARHAQDGMVFDNPHTLLGAALVSGEPVISNTPSQDPRSGSLPPGHPPLTAYLGLPIHAAGELVAMVGLTNRAGAYTMTDVQFLQPLLNTVGQMEVARSIERARSNAEAELAHTSALLAEKTARWRTRWFVLVLLGLGASPEDAAAEAGAIARKILAALNQPYSLRNADVHSTPSIGVALFRDAQQPVSELLQRADLAMYQAKVQGRNTLCFFDPAMQAAASARSALENDIRQGLQRHEFLLHYQPVVNEARVVLGAEALVRWQHPQRGMVPPGDFIPLAEQTGLILPLGRQVMRMACEQLSRWAAQARTATWCMAVNVSAKEFRHPDFVPQVLDTLRICGANPHQLKLELTESLLLQDVEDSIAKMQALRMQGVGFSLDDFGTGYSSLSYLKRLPLDQLKIDQGFVRDVLTDPNDATIACTIIALAHSLGLDVVAEDVETESQREFLLRNGCRHFQGYLFGRPGPAQNLSPD